MMSNEELYIIATGFAAGLAEQVRSGYRPRRWNRHQSIEYLSELERWNVLASAIEWLRVAAAAKLAELV